MHPVIEKNPDLKIPVGLARFIKKWGFTREKESGEGNRTRPMFSSIIQGAVYYLVFSEGSGKLEWLGDYNDRFLLGRNPNIDYNDPAPPFCVKEAEKILKRACVLSES